MSEKEFDHKRSEQRSTRELLHEVESCLAAALNVLPLQYPNHRLWACLKHVMPELKRREKKTTPALAKLCDAISKGEIETLDAPLAWAAQIVEQLESATKGKGKNDGN